MVLELEKVENIQKEIKMNAESEKLNLKMVNIDNVDSHEGLMIFFLLVFQVLNSKMAVETKNQSSLRIDMSNFRSG